MIVRKTPGLTALQYLFVIANIVYSINIDGLASQSPFPKKIHDIEVNANVLRRPKKSLQMDSAVTYCSSPRVLTVNKRKIFRP
jgi:hypothetical protein